MMLWWVLYVDSANGMGISHDSSSKFRLRKRLVGSNTHPIDGGIIAQPTTNKAYKVTRDGSSNWEIFFDGVSKGTVTDSDITTSAKIYFENGNTAGPTTYTDDLKVH